MKARLAVTLVLGPVLLAGGCATKKSLRNVVSTLDDYKLIAETTVQFAFGQDKLTPEAQAALDKLAGQKRNLRRFAVVVEGFTDGIGSVEYSNTLSQLRANTVVSYL